MELVFDKAPIEEPGELNSEKPLTCDIYDTGHREVLRFGRWWGMFANDEDLLYGDDDTVISYIISNPEMHHCIDED